MRALKRSKFAISQATLSRDLSEMGIGRFNNFSGRNFISATEVEDPRLKSLLSYETQSIEHNESMVVITTLPGRAHGVAEQIDNLHHPDILATLAGDNAIFVAPKSIASIEKLYKDLRRLITE